MAETPRPEYKRRTALKRRVLFIHGGGEKVREADKKLAASLRDALGTLYDVRYPEMPAADRPWYETWKGQIAKVLAALDEKVILVGHSLGASVLLKYLSEEEVEKPVAGLFLVAAPYWGAEDWEVEEYELREDFASTLPGRLPMFFYHSRDDKVVPFGHLALYQAKLPKATVRELDGRGHQFGDDLSEVARDIREGVR
jgi:predicted alpha/beta hydrolase family esterase